MDGSKFNIPLDEKEPSLKRPHDEISKDQPSQVPQIDFESLAKIGALKEKVKKLKEQVDEWRTKYYNELAAHNLLKGTMEGMKQSGAFKGPSSV